LTIIYLYNTVLTSLPLNYFNKVYFQSLVARKLFSFVKLKLKERRWQRHSCHIVIAA